MTKAVVSDIFSRSKYPCQKFRQVAGILGYARKYGKASLEKCCAAAFESGRCSYTFIKNTIAEYAEPENLPASESEIERPKKKHDTYAVDSSKYDMASLLKRQEVLF